MLAEMLSAASERLIKVLAMMRKLMTKKIQTVCVSSYGRLMNWEKGMDAVLNEHDGRTWRPTESSVDCGGC